MAKDNSIIINSDNFLRGIGSSEFLGNEELFLLDTKSKPGVLRVNNKTTKESGSIVNNYPAWIANNGDEMFSIDRSGYVYTRNSTGSWTDVSNSTRGTGQGIAFWKGHLFAFRDTQIDISDDDGTSWTTNWNTGALMGDSTWHPTFVATNDVLYFGCGQYLGSIKEIGTFDPTDSGTYEFKAGSATNNAVDLPFGSEIRDIEQLGTLLYIGSNNEDLGRAEIFPWDTTSTSFIEPIRLLSSSLNALLTHNNLVYIWDKDGGISITNGASVKEIARIPREEIGFGLGARASTSPSATTTWRNKIYFGLVGEKTSVWSIDGDILNKEYSISTGEENANALSVVKNTFNDSALILGWKSSTGQGFDKVDDDYYYTGYQARFISNFYSLGNIDRKVTIDRGDIALGKKLVSGEGIKLYYRREDNDSWTLHQTFTELQSSFRINSIINIEKIQFKIEVTTPSGSKSTPEILQISFNI